jgi:GntR family L-lactate dehydrogenase operon transcriptional regulator
MLKSRDEQQYLVLRIVAASPGVAGSGSISQGLRRLGINISEATIGRILRELDHDGHTVRDGFKGRALTDKGRMRMEEIGVLRRRLDQGNHFVALLSATGQKELIDVLVARRALERETARLAATLITVRELEELREAVRRHQELTDAGSVGAEEDVEFHRIIAQASGNHVLQAAMDLIRQEVQLSPLLHYIRKQVDSTVVEDHIAILRRLEERDPARAEEAMVSHMENLIRDVKRYWAQYKRQADSNGEGALA